MLTGELSDLSKDQKSQDQTPSELSLLGLHANAPTKLVDSVSSNVLKSDTGTSGLSNLASVYLKTIPAVPREFVNALSADINSPGETALKVLESTAIGLGTAVLLARSPVLAKSLLTIGGVGAGTLALGSTISFSEKAFRANSAAEQIALANSAGKTLGKLSAEMLETAPGLIIGSHAGLRLSKQFAPISTISESVKNIAELPARRLSPEGLHYFSLDARTIRFANAESEASNVLQAAQEMMKSTPWRGVEEGRFFKLHPGASEIKFSARLPGSQAEVYMGKRAEQMFHTHESRLLPTSGDFNTVYNTGVIGVPKEGVITFYEGTGKEAESIIRLQRAGKAEEFAQAAQALEQKTFRTIVVSPQNELSVRVDLRWSSEHNGMMPVSIKPVDYADAVKKLSKWTGKLNIEAMQTSSEALLKPGMTDFIRKIGSGI